MTLAKTTEYALRTLRHMSHREHAVFSADLLHRELKIPKKYLQPSVPSQTATPVEGRHPEAVVP